MMTFLIGLGCLLAGVTIGAVAVAFCVAASRNNHSCICLHPAPVIEVEGADLVPCERGEKHIRVKFHADRQWLLKFKDSTAIRLSSEVLSDSLDGEWKG